MRVLIALLITIGMAIFYVVLIWAFVQFVWPILPAWIAMIGFIAIAVFTIGSPIWWLARWSNRAVPEIREKRDRSDPQDQERPDSEP